MKRKRIDSSAVTSVGYEQASNTLGVEYRNLGVYRYFLVPAPLFQQLLNADSKGRFINTRIKPVYPCLRLH